MNDRARQLTRRASDRAAATAGSATMAVDESVRALRAAGQDVILLNSGEVDYEMPAGVVDAAARACSEPATSRYSATAGHPALRELVAEEQSTSGVPIGPNQVVVTNGAKHAVFAALFVLLDAGDEVILPAPYWTTFPEAIRLAGGTPVVVPTTEVTDFEVTVDQLDEACTSRTRAVILVSPGNPTGAVYGAPALRAIARWALDRGVWVIFDEVYRGLAYDEASRSILEAAPEIADQCLILGGIGKGFCMTGWRVGWVIGPADVARTMVRVQSQSVSHVSNVAQVASRAALEQRADYLPRLGAELQRRRLAMREGLVPMRGVTAWQPKGGLYFFVNVRELMAAQGYASTEEVAGDLLDRGHVAVVPGEAFGAPGYLRLSFTPDVATIRSGLARICDVLYAERR